MKILFGRAVRAGSVELSDPAALPPSVADAQDVIGSSCASTFIWTASPLDSWFFFPIVF